MTARWIRCPVSTQLVTFQKCLDCAASYEGQVNPATGERQMCHFRWSYLHYLVTQADHRQQAGISATMLTNCLRQAWWNEHRDYAIDPEKQMAAADGTAWHHLMDEHPQPGTWGEQRLYLMLPSGHAITGQFDRLIATPSQHRTVEDENEPEYWIEDYKHKGDGKMFVSPPDYYTIQLNIYRLMIETGATNMTTGERIPPGKVTRLTLLPSQHDAQGKPVNVPLLDLDALVAYLEECLSFWHEATTSNPPPRNKDPEHPRNNFCRTYCPHFSACCGVGGEVHDAKYVLFERSK